MPKIIQVDYDSGDFVVRLSPRNMRLLPEDTQEHLKAARKEMLLAFRSCLDSALDVLDRPRNPAPGARRTYIRVEEDEEEARA